MDGRRAASLSDGGISQRLHEPRAHTGKGRGRRGGGGWPHRERAQCGGGKADQGLAARAVTASGQSQQSGSTATRGGG